MKSGNKGSRWGGEDRKGKEFIQNKLIEKINPTTTKRREETQNDGYVISTPFA